MHRGGQPIWSLPETEAACSVGLWRAQTRQQEGKPCPAGDLKHQPRDVCTYAKVSELYNKCSQAPAKSRDLGT